MDVISTDLLKLGQIPEKPERRLGKIGFWIFLAIACVVFAINAANMVENGMPNADEGFYAMASKEVWRGRIPYRDFAYTQMPLFPYIQGAIMEGIGFGVKQQRYINVFWGACVIILIAGFLVKKKCVHWTSPLLLLLWTGSLPLVYYCSIGKSYSLTQLLLIIAAYGLWNRRPVVGLVWVAVFGVLAMGCRLTAAPAVAILYLGAALSAYRCRTSLITIVGLPVITTLLVLGPFYVADPVNAIYWTWLYHFQSRIMKKPIWFIAYETVLMAPGLVMLGFYAVTRMRGLLNQWTPFGWCLLAAFSGVVVNIVVPSVYSEYTVIFMPLLLLGASGCIGLMSERKRVGVVVLLVVATIAASAVNFRFYYEPGYLRAVDHAACYLTKNTSRDATVLSSVPEIPLSAGREHVRGLEMGCFSITAEMSETEARVRHVITISQLVEMLDAGVPSSVVLSTKDAWNFYWSVPSLRPFSERTKDHLVNILNKGYFLAYENEYFLVLLRKDRLEGHGR